MNAKQRETTTATEVQNASVLNEVLSKSVEKIGLLETIERAINAGKYFELHNFQGAVLDILRMKSKCKVFSNRKAADNEGRTINVVHWYIWGTETVADDGEVVCTTRLAMLDENLDLMVTASQYAVRDFIGIISEIGLGEIPESIPVELIGIDAGSGHTVHRLQVV